MEPRDEVTELLVEAQRGAPEAMERLYPLVYAELRRLAQSQLGRERSDHTLQATALVHEAYLKLVDQTRAEWANRGHFFAVAAQAMRRILVDYARARARKKRGGDFIRMTRDALDNVAASRPTVDVIELDEALRRLGEFDAVKAQVVELRFFGGLTSQETGDVLGLSLRTVERHWAFARAWLFRELAGDEGDEGEEGKHGVGCEED